MADAKPLGIIGKVARARSVGIAPSLLDTTGEYVLGPDGNTAFLSDIREAISLTKQHPEATVVWPNPDGTGTHRVTIEAEEGAEAALLEAHGLEVMPETLTFTAGPYTIRHYSVPAPFDGQHDLAPGVQVLGTGTASPVPGTDFGGYEVVVACNAAIATLPESIRAALYTADDEGDAPSAPSPTDEDPPPAPLEGGEEAVPDEVEETSLATDDREDASGSYTLATMRDADFRSADEDSPLEVREQLRKFGEVIDSARTEPDGSGGQRLVSPHLAVLEEVRDTLLSISHRGDLAPAELLRQFVSPFLKLTTGRESYALETSKRWRRTDQSLLLTETTRSLISALERAIPLLFQDAVTRSEVRKSLKRYLTSGGLRSLGDFAKTYSDLHGHVGWFDTKPGLISTANGLVDPSTMSLRQRVAADYIMRATNEPYIPGESCPEFDAFLHDAFEGDRDVIWYFLKFLGYSLLGCPKEKLLLVLFGETDTGKSRFLAALAKILGPLVEWASRAIIFKLSQGSATQPHVVRVIGSRLVIISESRKREVLDDTALKSMTGGVDDLVIRTLYKEPIRVTPTWVALLATNFVPRIPTDDPALLRRLVFVRFSKGVRPRDPQMYEKFLQEGRGILNRLIEGAHGYLQEGLELPESLRVLREQVLASAQEPIRTFFEECFELDPTGRVRAEEVRELALQWFPAHGAALPSDKMLGDFVRIIYDPGQVKPLKSSGVMVYTGVRLRQPAVAPEQPAA